MNSIVREGETLAALAARLGALPCMLLRANGLYSPAWLLPGREIFVPDANYCARRGAFVCPEIALRLPAWSGKAYRLDPKAPPQSDFPRRLCLHAQTQAVFLPSNHLVTVVAHYGETWESFSRQYLCRAENLMRLNRYWGPLLPGMRLAIEIL